MDTPIQAHNQKPASVWNSGGARYEEISRGARELKITSAYDGLEIAL